MMKPLLQLALDCHSIEDALSQTHNVAPYLDIIEVGTVLAVAQGISAVQFLKKAYPNHIIVCDLKTTDAGATLAKMAFEAGADWLTVSAAAHPATKAACKKITDEFNANHPELTVKKEIQIELYGNWTLTDAKGWLDLGITQAIYHRSRDAELAGKGWEKDDIQLMKALSDMGFALSITGGITSEDLYLFKDIQNVKAFIAGRSLTGTNGKATALAIREQIDKYW